MIRLRNFAIPLAVLAWTALPSCQGDSAGGEEPGEGSTTTVEEGASVELANGVDSTGGTDAVDDAMNDPMAGNLSDEEVEEALTGEGSAY